MIALMNYDNVTPVYSNNDRLVSYPIGNWAPRLGIAYQADPRTVFRVGAGIYYGGIEPGGGSGLVQNLPYVISSSLTTPSCSNGSYCPSLQAQGATIEGGLGPFLTNGIGNFISYPATESIQPNVHTPYTVSYNGSVQMALTNSMTGTIGYVGNAGRHLVTLSGGMNFADAIVPSNVNTKVTQPAPQWSSNQYEFFEGMSNYNSLQTKVEKRFTKDLGFLVSYTWAHSLDDTIDLLGGDLGTYRDPKLIPIQYDYTSSNYDVRHVFNVNMDYALPFGRGQRWANHGRILDTLIGGWRMDNVFQARSGLPFRVTTSGVTNVAGPSSYNPYMVGDPYSTNLSAPQATATTVGNPNCNPSLYSGGVRNKTHWYNACAFSNPLNSTTLTTNPAQWEDGTFTYSAPAIPSPVNPSGPPLEGALSSGGKQPYINTTAKALLFTGGVANQMHGPGYWRLNTSLFKDFTTFREQQLEFRADVFNILNHPSLGTPSSTGDNGGNIGQITGPAPNQPNTVDARFFQLSAKYIF
jgi:hypothetical protein